MKNIKMTSYSVVLVLALVVLSITIPFFDTYKVAELQLLYAQIKGGLSASSVNPPLKKGMGIPPQIS
jgi:hypothetical protein